MRHLNSSEMSALENSGLFEADWYSQRYPDVGLTGLSPIDHFIFIGARLDRNPSPSFNTRFYRAEYPDVEAAGINPLLHFVLAGRDEGCHPLPPHNYVFKLPNVIERMVDYRVDRTSQINSEEDWIIFVAYSTSGKLNGCQNYQISRFSEAGYKIVLVVNTDRITELRDHSCTTANFIIVRENVGYDFGAWRHAIELIGGLVKARSVSFTNDSIFPVRDSIASISNIRLTALSSPHDFVFLTENAEIKPHSQSYFFSINQNSINNRYLKLISKYPYYNDKDSLIKNVEVNLSSDIRDSGLSVGNLFHVRADRNPTIHNWRELIDNKFPFIKIQLITSGFINIDDDTLASFLGDQPHFLLKKHCADR